MAKNEVKWHESSRLQHQYAERSTEEVRELFRKCVEQCRQRAADGSPWHHYDPQVVDLAEIVFYFPTNQQEDAHFPVEELRVLLELIDDALKDEREMQLAALNGAGLEKGTRIFFDYYRRNGPGTAYLAAFSLFSQFARQRLRPGDDIRSQAIALTAIVGLVESCVSAATEALQRIPVLPSEDSTATLKVLKGLFWLIRRDPRFAFESDENQRSKLLHQVLHLGESSIVLENTHLCIELFCFANDICGGKEVAYDSLTMDDSSWVMRNLLLDALVKLNASGETQLLLIQALFQQDVGLTQNVIRLVPIGLDLIRQLPNKANGFLGALSNCLRVNHMMAVLIITSMPEVLQLVEGTASTTNIDAVKFLLRYFFLICKRSSNVLPELLKETQPMLELSSLPLKLTDVELEGVEQRLAQKLVELFSQPSFLVNQNADEFGRVFEQCLDDGVPIRVHEKWAVPLEYPPYLDDTFVMLTYRIADGQFTWVHKKVFSAIMFRITDLTIHPKLFEASRNLLIWLSDRGRLICDDSEEEFEAMSSMTDGIRLHPLFESYNVDLVLLLTLLRAPTVLSRLRAKSKLRFLPGDMIRKLSEMLSSFTFEYEVFYD